MNNENLKRIQSSNEARELGRLGGKKRVENARRKKNVLAYLKAFNQNGIKDENLKRNLMRMGMSEEEAEQSGADAMVAYTLIAQISRGNIKAIETYLKMTNQNPEKLLEMKIRQAELDIKKKELELRERELDSKLNGVSDEDGVIIINDINDTIERTDNTEVSSDI